MNIRNKTNHIVENAKSNMEQENKYKKYIIENTDYIRSKVAINASVLNIKEAVMLIEKVDLRYVFNFDFALHDIFKCEFITQDKFISFVYNSEEERTKLEAEIRAEYESKIMSINIYEKFGFKCEDIKICCGSNDDYIVKNRNGKYKYVVGYFTEKSFKRIVSMDIFDLYQIFLNCDFKGALEGLCNLLNLRIFKVEALKDRCKENIVMLNKLDKSKYKYLNKLIFKRKYDKKLEKILNEFLNKAYLIDEFEDKVAISIALENLGDEIGVSKSTLSPIVNIFCLLGFLQKIKMKRIVYKRYNKNEINNLFVPQLNEMLFAEAEKRAEILLNNNEIITVSKFKYEYCLELFGANIANEIFLSSRKIQL